MTIRVFLISIIIFFSSSVFSTNIRVLDFQNIIENNSYLSELYVQINNDQETHKEEFSKINNYDKTLDRCHSTVGIAILNTSITIVFGFSMLVLSNFIPTIYFGVFTGIAMLLAMISVLTLLPKLILTFKPFGNEADKII